METANLIMGLSIAGILLFIFTLCYLGLSYQFDPQYKPETHSWPAVLLLAGVALMVIPPILGLICISIQMELAILHPSPPALFSWQ